MRTSTVWRFYLYWPPFPVVLFMPLVAAFGVGVSDAPLTLAAGGLNVALVAMLLKAMDRRGIARLSAAKRAWLTAFFALGTVHITLAPFPRVWFTALVIGFALSCGAYLAALWMPRSWGALLSGVLVGCAFLTRSVTLLAAIWVGWYLYHPLRRPVRRRS